MSRSFKLALIVSFAAHIAAGFFLLNHTSRQKPLPAKMGAIQPMVKAVAVDLKTVEKEIKRIEDNEKRVLAEEQQRLKAIQAKANAAKQQVLAEQKRINALKKEQVQMTQDAKKKAELAKLDMQKINQEQKNARQKLADLTEQQRKAAVAMKRAQEQAKKEAELAEKKRQIEFAEKQQAQLAHQRRDKLRNVSDLDRYKAMVREAIRLYWTVPDDLDPSLMCQLLVRVAPGGDVLDVQVLKSSGDNLLDHSARTAVLKASPLPVPDDAVLFDHFRELRLTVRPEGVDSYF